MWRAFAWQGRGGLWVVTHVVCVGRGDNSHPLPSTATRQQLQPYTGRDKGPVAVMQPVGVGRGWGMVWLADATLWWLPDVNAVTVQHPPHPPPPSQVTLHGPSGAASTTRHGGPAGSNTSHAAPQNSPGRQHPGRLPPAPSRQPGAWRLITLATPVPHASPLPPTLPPPPAPHLHPVQRLPHLEEVCPKPPA